MGLLKYFVKNKTDPLSKNLDDHQKLFKQKLFKGGIRAVERNWDSSCPCQEKDNPTQCRILFYESEMPNIEVLLRMNIKEYRSVHFCIKDKIGIGKDRLL